MSRWDIARYLGLTVEDVDQQFKAIHRDLAIVHGL
jgi:hypothetical protein